MDEFYVGAHVIVNKNNCFTPACAQYHGEIIGDTETSTVWRVSILEPIRESDKHYGLQEICRIASRYMRIDDTYEDPGSASYEIDISSLL